MTHFDNPSGGNRLRKAWITFGVLAMLSLAYAGFWFFLALGVQERALDWVAEQRVRGWTVRYDSLQATGFPFSIRLDITNPGIGAPNAARPWGWEGERLQALFRPWNLQAGRLTTSGQQMLAVPYAGGLETFNGSATGIEALFGFSGAGLRDVRLKLAGVNLKPETVGLGEVRIETADVHLGRVGAQGGDHKTPTWELAGAAENLILPWLKVSPLGPKIESLNLDGRLMGALEKGPLIESLENWRDGGGTVEIGKLILQHGALLVRADGTLALDGGLQPIGALTARIEGFFETIDALKGMGVVKPRDAVTAKIVLGVLSRKPANGGAPTLNLALTVQDSRLYAGPVRLLKIPEVDWRKVF